MDHNISYWNSWHNSSKIDPLGTILDHQHTLDQLVSPPLLVIFQCKMIERLEKCNITIPSVKQTL